MTFTKDFNESKTTADMELINNTNTMYVYSLQIVIIMNTCNICLSKHHYCFVINYIETLHGGTIPVMI